MQEEDEAPSQMKEVVMRTQPTEDDLNSTSLQAAALPDKQEFTSE